MVRTLASRSTLRRPTSRASTTTAVSTRCRVVRTPVVSYTDHGSIVFNPAASNGAVSRVATIIPLAAAVAAM